MASAEAVAVEKIDDIASCPVARPDVSGILPFSKLNPAWQGAFDKFRALIPKSAFASSDGMTEAEWNTVMASFGAYSAWMGSKKGEQVEALGIDEVKAVLASDMKQVLLELISKDKALERGAYGNPDASVHLNWNQAAGRIDRLIRDSEYLKPAD